MNNSTPTNTQANASSVQTTGRPVLPVGVKIISWIFLLGGLFSIFFSLGLILFHPLGFFQLLIGILYVVLAFWIRRLRRSALIVYTFLTLLQIPLAFV